MLRRLWPWGRRAPRAAVWGCLLTDVGRSRATKLWPW